MGQFTQHQAWWQHMGSAVSKDKRILFQEFVRLTERALNQIGKRPGPGFPERMCREGENNRNLSSGIRSVKRQYPEQAQATKDIITRQDYGAPLCTSTEMWTQSHTSLKCLYPNTHSTGNKQDQLEICVQSQTFNLTVITETQWDSSHDWNAAMKGYTTVQERQIRKSHWWDLALCEAIFRMHQTPSWGE